MWLYGFTLKDCHLGLNGYANFKDNYVFYTELYALAAKYDVSQLKADVEALFKSHCSLYSASAGRQAHTLSWYFPLLRHVLDDPEIATSLRDIVLASFRQNANRLWSMTEPDKSKFWKEMQDWPELAFHLLATGGLDGKACKIFAEGKVPLMVAPTPVMDASDVGDTAVAPIRKVTPRGRKVAAFK